MSSKLRDALLPLLDSARDHYYELMDLEARPEASPYIVSHVAASLGKDTVAISDQLDDAIIDMRANLITDMDIFFSYEYYLRYEHHGGMEFTPDHSLVLAFTGAVSTLDCKSPSRQELILACQVVAGMLNILLREANVPLVVFVTVADPDAE